MHASLRRLLLGLVALLLCAGTAVAQTGTVAGVVVDAETGETLPGTNVVVDGTQTGTTTDMDGAFELEVEAGTYDLRITFVGYQATTVTGLAVSEGSTERVEVALAAETAELDEVIVTAEAARNSEAGLLRQRQKAGAVSDAISAEAISRSGGSDAADAMEKVTGASVVGGKYVFVRGLGDRYSSTQLNGVDLPSADPDRNSVQFDLFPSNLLENIVTLKTFTPDKPGSFSGGLVDINTRAFPAELDVQFSASTTYNTQTHFRDDFLTYDGADLGVLGTYGGLSGVPGALRQVAPNEVPNVVSASRDANLAQQLDRFTKSFNGVMAPGAGTAPVNQSYSLSVGNQNTLFGNQLGYLASVSYGRSASFYEDGVTNRYSFLAQGESTLAPDLLLDDTRGTQSVDLGALANVTYRLGANNEIGVNALYSRSGETTARLQQGRWPKEFGANDTSSLFVGRALTYTQRSLYSVKLRGEHLIDRLFDTSVQWSGSFSDTEQEEPDTRFFASTRRMRSDGSFSYGAGNAGFSDPSRYFRSLSEQSYGASLDLSTPFKQWSGLKSRLKVGGTFKTDDRSFTERAFSISPELPFEGDEATYFSARNMGIIRVDELENGELRYRFGNYLQDSSKPKNNYMGTRTVAAGYAMIEMPLAARLRAIAGARFETTQLNVDSEAPGIETGDINEADVLPSLNLVYELTDAMNVRAAVTRTLARPNFREIAPFERFDFILGNFEIGNPGLDRTLIDNADLRWEWFARPGELVAASVFYKRLTNPIETVLLGSTNGQRTWQNVDQGTVYGAEFEVRSRLDILLEALADFSVGANLSLIHSEVDIASDELQRRRSVDPDASATRQLQGQSPYLVNADLSYDNPEIGTSAGLFFDVFGPRLAEVGLFPVPDVYERPSPQVDFTFSQRFFEAWKLKVSAKNLLDSAVEKTYDFDGAQTYVYERYERGRSFSLGISYSL